MSQKSNMSETQLKSDVDTLVANSNQFAFDLYSKLAEHDNENLFYSPSSVSYALAMAFAGANAETAQEMADTLRFTLAPERFHEAFRRLQSDTRTGGVEFRIANRLWGQTGYHFLPEFLQTTEHCYGAKLAEVDFEHATEAARKQINGWVEKQTADKIKNLIPPDVLDSMTRLVLTNAVYFLGIWEDEFFEELTGQDPFWITSKKQVSIPMMHQTTTFSYGDFDDLQVVELPYRSRCVETLVDDSTQGYDEVEFPEGGSDFSMCILLPRKIDGLADIERQLNDANLQKWTTLRACKVKLNLPRFRVESSFQLEEQLELLGMERPFSINDADFSKMSDNPEGLYIGAILHKAFVDVNERGTEAAAVTAMVMVGGCAMKTEPLKEFRADHPFLLLIRDRKTRMIHFIGRVTNPS